MVKKQADGDKCFLIVSDTTLLIIGFLKEYIGCSKMALKMVWYVEPAKLFSDSKYYFAAA